MNNKGLNHLIVLVESDIENGRRSIYQNPKAKVLIRLWEDCIKLDEKILEELKGQKDKERNMNELQELHIRGELSENGYLKETYDNEREELKHELTGLGKNKVRALFKDIKWRQEFMRLALEEAKKHPKNAQMIIKVAIEKTTEMMK